MAKILSVTKQFYPSNQKYDYALSDYYFTGVVNI